MWLVVFYLDCHRKYSKITKVTLSIPFRGLRVSRNISVVTSEVAAWLKNRNEKSHTVDWQFIVDNARIKLKRLYPIIVSDAKINEML